MRLHTLVVHNAASCGGLLDGIGISFSRNENNPSSPIAPLCLLGPNGSGKSQLLQLLSEIFQAAWHSHSDNYERISANSDALFELVYAFSGASVGMPTQVRLSRLDAARPNLAVSMHRLENGEWLEVTAKSIEYARLLPSLIVGYTSGNNETLSLPFLLSRSGYAEDVGKAALTDSSGAAPVPENKLMMVDYSTHLEVLVANLLLGPEPTRRSILDHAGMDRLASYRCIIQLNHSNAPKARARRNSRKGVQLTDELERYVDSMRRSATCWHYDEKTETYTFDYRVDAQTEKAFGNFFESSISLYKAFHKLALLNDLMIEKRARQRIVREAKDRHFASRLPEPQEETKVFRFEQVKLYKRGSNSFTDAVDYVSLSDGEHQQAQIFGIFSMLTEGGVLFLLDEPESHFNPQWRVKFVKRLADLPAHPSRGIQEVILTSHAPFVPSDLPREQVLIFTRNDGRIEVRKPDIETYGATFDRILDHCFDVRPPISQLARDDISHLQKEGTVGELREAMDRLGSSVEKAYLADRLRQLEKKQG